MTTDQYKQATPIFNELVYLEKQFKELGVSIDVLVDIEDHVPIPMVDKVNDKTIYFENSEILDLYKTRYKKLMGMIETRKNELEKIQ